MSKQNLAIAAEEAQPIYQFTEKAYLDYSMYVILDRALPHIGDGLKPVQRRIVYAMSELGLSAVAKFKKSARTVGDVLGKYHPHGDSACYESMVLMAQSFSYRYPLIDGQGNWGSADDPKSFAAMRYTEAKLTKYAEVLLQELGQGTVDWQPNFDGTLQEPKTLPARLPNILLNGCSGIAVGMATDIPPHNLREVVDACLHLLDNEKASVAEIGQFIKGPDFPTQAEIITPAEDIQAIYQTGHGSVKMRAVYEKGKEEIIITALPHQVSGAKVLEQIAAQMQAKKLPMLVDLRDESDHENPTRLVLVPRSNRIDTDELMSHLFASTDLERSYRINLNVVGLNGKPQVKNIKTLLAEWLCFRTDTVKRRLQFRLDKVTDRLEVLAGLLIAYLNIDEVIRIIREEDSPKEELMRRFKLTERQSNAILDMRLRHLAKLEEIKITQEQKELTEEQDWLEKTLQSSRRLKTLIKKELQEAAERYGDERSSPLVERGEAKAIKQEALLPNEAVTIILSKKGWVRSAKGHEVDYQTLNYKAGDSFCDAAHGRSNQLATFIDSTGRSYSLPAHQLPSARSHGEPLTSSVKPPSGAEFVAVLGGEEEHYYLLGSDAGYGFVTQLKELQVRNRSGKAVIKLPENSQVLTPCRIEALEKQLIVAVTNQGRLLTFPVSDLPIMPRGKGNKIINIPKSSLESREEYVVGITVIHSDQAVTIFAGKRKLILKANDLEHYRGERGRRGNKLPRGLQKVTAIQAGEN